MWELELEVLSQLGRRGSVAIVSWQGGQAWEKRLGVIVTFGVERVTYQE